MPGRSAMRDARITASAADAISIVWRTHSAIGPYIRTWVGFAYLALVTDVYSRRILGWALTTHMRTDLPLEALEMAIWTRQRQRSGAASVRGGQRSGFDGREIGSNGERPCVHRAFRAVGFGRTCRDGADVRRRLRGRRRHR